MDRTTSSSHDATTAPASRNGTTPRLESGDRLTRDEFERRYEAMPEGIKCELIDGVVYVGSPVKDAHSGPDGLVNTWLGVYASETPGTRHRTNPTVRLDEVSEPQPDSLLRIESEAGGLSRIDEDGYIAGGVELAAEVAASSESYDLHQKKAAYLRNGVREYLAVVVRQAEVVWFALERGAYARLEPDRTGVIRSRVFPGLWLDARALLAGDGTKVLSVLRRGMASKGHAAFVRQLAGARRRRR